MGISKIKISLSWSRGWNSSNIGLGTGHVASMLQEYGYRGDVVELNSDIVELARKFFNFEQTGRIIVDDGRKFIEEFSQDPYDIIIQDVFNGQNTPHLHTLEMFTLINKILKPNGIFVLNILGYLCCDFDATVLGRSILMTLHEVFKEVRTFYDDPAALDYPFPTNIIFYASQQAIKFSSQKFDLTHRRLYDVMKGFHTEWELTNHPFFSPNDSENGTVIDDEGLEQLSVWDQPTRDAYRSFVIQSFSTVPWTDAGQESEKLL